MTAAGLPASKIRWTNVTAPGAIRSSSALTVPPGSTSAE
jgi:hypothetical protein